MSTPVPHPATAQATLLKAGQLGRRHGKAAAYWQIGDSSDTDARPFYRDLLRGISEVAQQITGLYEVPDLTARWDYDRDSLAADLGLASDGPSLAHAADTYLAAAREEFWREAARLARRRLHPGPDHRAGDGGQAAKAQAEDEDEDEDDAAAGGADVRQDITDRATGLSQLLSERCSTCILRPGDKMYLGPEQTAAFVRHALAEGTYVVCHQTLTYGDHPDFGPAICRGFFNAYAGRSPALRLLRAFGRLTEVVPPRPGQRPGRRRPVIRAEAASQLRALASAVVWNLCVLAVIRPYRDGWLIFMGGRRMVGTAEAADALLVGDHRGGVPMGPC